MGKIKSLFFSVIRFVYFRYKTKKNRFLSKIIKLGHRGVGCQIGQPSIITNSELVFMCDYARLSPYNIILNHKGRFVMGKYSIASMNLLVVPDTHTSTVGIPHCCLGSSHVHDKVEDVIVDEDVWIGANVTLLGGAHLCRGCIVGANSLINKRTKTPPYSVVVGSPARIIAVKFSIEQILQHEEKLYPPEERFSKAQLEELFKEYYDGKRVFGMSKELTIEEQGQLQYAMKIHSFKYPVYDKK